MTMPFWLIFAIVLDLAAQRAFALMTPQERERRGGGYR
jgi:hypothetical protein